MMPDVEEVCVGWAKADGVLNPLLSGRIATRLPKEWETSWLRVQLLDGSLAVAETGDVVDAIVQWDAFAKSATASPNYSAAWDVVAKLIDRAAAVNDIPVTAQGQIMSFGRITGPRRLDHAEMRWARFSVDTYITVRP